MSETETTDEGGTVLNAVPKRHFSLREVELPHSGYMSVRAGEGETPIEATLVGWPSTTGNRYAVEDWLGEYGETINAGAFGKTLQEASYIPMLLDHRGDVLAAFHSEPNRTMDLAEDGKGLRSEALLDLVDNSSSRNVYSGVKRGDLSKMSFAFRAIKETWNEEYTERGVDECQVYDVSVVKSPANPMTSVLLRASMVDYLGREGQAILWSARTAMELMTTETRSIDPASEPWFEKGIEALRSVDERMYQMNPYYGRARLCRVADLMLEIRAGKVLSSSNEQMLRSSLEALSQADNALKQVASASVEAQNAINGVLGTTQPNEGGAKVANDGGLDTGKLNDGNPVLPNDGAGSRSIPPSVLKAQRELELMKLRQSRR